MDVVIYPDANGLEQLYRPDSTFVAGTPAHDIYVIVPTDVDEHIHGAVDELLGAVNNLSFVLSRKISTTQSQTKTITQCTW